MIKRDTLIQGSSATVWQVPIPDGSRKGRPLAAYDSDGNSLEWDSWQFDNGVLFVNFGIDPVTGELEYEYQNDEQTTVTTVEGEGGVINVTINQHNGPPVSQ